jgi:amidase
VRLVPYTAPYNITGQPGIALPLHWTSDGLPLGIQLISRYGGEDILLPPRVADRGSRALDRAPSARLCVISSP